jgi:hypothetical protein
VKKKLIPQGDGKAIVIDLPLLAIIGAESATELELTTDGRRLILSVPSRSSVGFDRNDPKVAVRLLEELARVYGFTSEEFKMLHHFGRKASMEQHIDYCKGTARFRAETNAIVSDRLNHVLEHLRNGGSMATAIAEARRDFPFGKD